METWIVVYGVPAGALAIALLGLIFGHFVSSSFRKKYPLEKAEYEHHAPGE